MGTGGEEAGEEEMGDPSGVTGAAESTAADTSTVGAAERSGASVPVAAVVTSTMRLKSGVAAGTTGAEPSAGEDADVLDEEAASDAADMSTSTVAGGSAEEGEEEVAEGVDGGREPVAAGADDSGESDGDEAVVVAVAVSASAVCDESVFCAVLSLSMFAACCFACLCFSCCFSSASVMSFMLGPAIGVPSYAMRQRHTSWPMAGLDCGTNFLEAPAEGEGEEATGALDPPPLCRVPWLWLVRGSFACARFAPFICGAVFPAVTGRLRLATALATPRLVLRRLLFGSAKLSKLDCALLLCALLVPLPATASACLAGDPFLSMASWAAAKAAEAPLRWDKVPEAVVPGR